MTAHIELIPLISIAKEGYRVEVDRWKERRQRAVNIRSTSYQSFDLTREYVDWC
jgi:hypothetical protein